MRAAEDEIMARGVARLSLGAIARAAGVGRAAVYRRWGTGAELIADLVSDMVATSLPAPDLGYLRSDLRAHTGLVAKTLTDARQGPLFRAMICAGLSGEGADALGRFYRQRLSVWEACVTRAESRGEVPSGTRAMDVIVAASSPLYYRWLLLGEVPTSALAQTTADAATAAAKEGAFSS